MQAKNGSQASHNENNEGKEPAVTVNKQAAAQQTNSNTVKEEQESKQVVTKPQNNNNTSTATKQVKNNETSATIANTMVNNGETRSAVAPKTDENKNIATLDANKLSAESKNTKGNFLSLLNNFAVVKPQTGESNNTIALASGIATALTAGIGMLAEGKKRKRE